MYEFLVIKIKNIIIFALRTRFKKTQPVFIKTKDKKDENETKFKDASDYNKVPNSKCDSVPRHCNLVYEKDFHFYQFLLS